MKLKPKVIRFILFFALFSIFSIISYLNFSTSISRNKKNNNIISNANIDYKVHLKKNSYYESDVLPANMEYIASLIDYIDADVSYNIKSNDVLNYDYSYYVEAITRVYSDDSKKSVLYEKSDIILKEKKLTLDQSNNLSINENVKIDYNKYNMLVAAFKTSYLLTSNSDVTIVLHVNTKASSNISDKSVDIKEDSELVIPLTEQTIDVSIISKPSNSYDVMNESGAFIIKNKTKFIVFSVSSFFAIVSFIAIIVNFLTKKYNYINEYKNAVKKILKEYDLIIANVEHGVNEKDYKVVKLLTFNELKDVHDNIGNPILFVEDKKNNISNFEIIKEDIVYKFTLNSNDFKKDNIEE